VISKSGKNVKLNSLIKDQKLHAVSQIWNIENAKKTQMRLFLGRRKYYSVEKEEILAAISKIKLF